MDQQKTILKRTMIFCEPCSFKMILEKGCLPESLVEIKTSPIPGGIPQLDPKTGRAKQKPHTNQNKRYKCPKCGRGVVVKELQGAYSTTINQIEMKAQLQKHEEDRRQRIQDGKPPERPELENS